MFPLIKPTYSMILRLKIMGIKNRIAVIEVNCMTTISQYHKLTKLIEKSSTKVQSN